jgi:hypothetical protein
MLKTGDSAQGDFRLSCFGPLLKPTHPDEFFLPTNRKIVSFCLTLPVNIGKMGMLENFDVVFTTEKQRNWC